MHIKSKPVRSKTVSVVLYPWQAEALAALDPSGRPSTALYRVVEKAIEEHQKASKS
ncbi:MAG: hypothetical protein J0L70_18345 [Leptolyngbya sp. UWPOB_LEPTO1]|uniref:hypothetical protein n=1 Tax=Leptolyngbya sp. UWPOB_LEPTO1 TaxID=2815653 RepID=UPI001AD38122|nr:hypothetical protein [Leptolyngbya sp. UWPOB_LEPTO1]MBN8562496.1 hypothetical protein [Leptolyngbya sp. UWPOB_LEPTO1]